MVTVVQLCTFLASGAAGGQQRTQSVRSMRERPFPRLARTTMPHPGGVALIVLLITRVIGSHASPSTGQARRRCVSGVRSKKCTILSVKRSTPGPSYRWQGGSVGGVQSIKTSGASWDVHGQRTRLRLNWPRSSAYCEPAWLCTAHSGKRSFSTAQHHPQRNW